MSEGALLTRVKADLETLDCAPAFKKLEPTRRERFNLQCFLCCPRSFSWSMMCEWDREDHPLGCENRCLCLVSRIPLLEGPYVSE